MTNFFLLENFPSPRVPLTLFQLEYPLNHLTLKKKKGSLHALLTVQEKQRNTNVNIMQKTKNTHNLRAMYEDELHSKIKRMNLNETHQVQLFEPTQQSAYAI